MDSFVPEILMIKESTNLIGREHILVDYFIFGVFIRIKKLLFPEELVDFSF